MKRRASVVVLGGGPAGALAALTLARAGTPCCLLERHAEAADKVCGEFLSPEAIARLDGMGFPWQRAEAVPIRRLRLEAHGHGLSVTLPFEGRAVRRTFLDRWLLEQAERAGTRVELGVNVRGVERVGEGFGLSEARRAGVGLGPPKRGSAATRRKSQRDSEIGQGRRKPSPARSRAAKRAAATRRRQTEVESRPSPGGRRGRRDQSAA